MFKLRDAIKQKRRGKLSLGVWLLHDNAQVHKSLVAQQAIRDCGSVQLNHPAYNPDLTPSDYYLFRNPKCHLRGTRFADDGSLKAVVEVWFEGHDRKCFLSAQCISSIGQIIKSVCVSVSQSVSLSHKTS